MTTPRVIFVGLDALDSGIANRLMDAGRLPVLGALTRRSLRAFTANPDGLVVGACWPTIWSGTSPGRHGFYCPRQFVPGRYEMPAVHTSRHRRTAVLDDPREAGRSVAALDVPLVRPTAPSGGVHVVDLGTHDRMLDPTLGPRVAPRGTGRSARSPPGSRDAATTTR